MPKNIKADQTPIPLCLVARKVASTLDVYNSDPNTAKDALPKLAKAEFEFKTVNADTLGLKLSIWVFSIGGSHKSEATNDVTFSYVVPPPPKANGMTLRQYIGLLERQPKPRDFSKELVATLRNAAQQVKETNTVGNAKFKTLTVSLAYGAMWDLTGGANIPISLVTIGPNLDHNRADTQTIKLTFENQTAGSSNNPR